MLKRKLYMPILICLAFFVVIRSNAGEPVRWAELDRASDTADNLLASEIPIHPEMQKFVSGYGEKNSDYFEKFKLKNAASFKLIDKIFTAHDVPVELKYLAVVESKLKTTALSKAGAAGWWQFMPGTAKRYGLKVAGKTDDRTHPWKSTRAAALYLKKLYSMYEDWLLVIAAYNCGPLPVYNAIKKSGSRNFWQLQYFLPKETRIHVKKFIATHYYFEGEGSFVTITKSEKETYLAARSRLKTALDEEQYPEVPSGNETSFCTWVAVINENDFLKFIARK